MKSRIKISLFSAMIMLVGLIMLIQMPTKVCHADTVSAQANAVSVSISADKTSFKTNKINGDIISLSVMVNNPSGVAMGGGQATIHIDPEIFEFTDLIASTDIARLGEDTRPSASNKAQGYVCIEGDTNDAIGISKANWHLGGYKIKIKNGVDFSSVSSSSIYLTDAEFFDALGDPLTVTISGDATINFAAPSNQCDLTALSSTQSGVSISKSGNNFTANVQFSVSALNTANLKPTVSEGAKVTYSPSGNVSLNEGANTITLTVTAEDGVATKQYTLTVTRAAGEEINTLSSLEVKNGSSNLLSKTAADLSSSITESLNPISYTDREKLSVVTAKNGEKSTVQIVLDGGNKYTGKATETSKTLALGSLQSGNHTLTVTVVPEKGNSTTYTITFVVEEDNSQINPGPGDEKDPNKPSDENSAKNSKFEKLPYILGMAFLGADNLLALIIILFMAFRKKKQ